MDETTLVTEIRALTGVAASQVSDTDMHMLVGIALNEYSYYNPNVNFTADSDYITTVGGQSNYAFPAGALWIIEVFWRPNLDGLQDQELRAYQDFTLSFDPAHPVDLSIYYRQLASLRRYFGGTWKILNGEIWLLPDPIGSGEKVAVLYATARTLTAMADVQDFLFKRLIAAYALQRRPPTFSRTLAGGQGLIRSRNKLGRQWRRRLTGKCWRFGSCSPSHTVLLLTTPHRSHLGFDNDATSALSNVTTPLLLQPRNATGGGRD